MNIAVEAHALSQEKITGVGMVILHYLEELQKIDRQNNYFIYTMDDDLHHVRIQNKRWQHVTFNYLIKKLRVSTRKRWLSLTDRGKEKKSPQDNRGDFRETILRRDCRNRRSCGREGSKKEAEKKKKQSN